MAEEAASASLAAGSHPALLDLLTEPSWKSRLGPEFDKGYFKSLEKFVHGEWAAQGPRGVFPPAASVFRAFNACPFDRVKVVILGQDPYHDDDQAMGLCFSVPRGTKVPSSLRNIYKELHADLGCRVPTHGDLEDWARQGVFMLNTVLTVRAHQANSHKDRGWEKLTDAAVAALSREREGIVFLLWGKQAQNAAKGVDRSRHHVLECPHPSGLSAHRGFFGSKHFSKTNELLEFRGLGRIDWQIKN
ncbi:unnamed protein product [Pedinophyceae sp. YPF-701]|nr:unnamed protein product [Pedinophyceae sp. YPF-701]